jgi:hypothetical protein
MLASGDVGYMISFREKTQTLFKSFFSKLPRASHGSFYGAGKTASTII